MKGIVTLKKSAVIAAVCLAVLCVSVYGQGAPRQEQKKVLSDAGGMIETFLQKGKYVKCYYEDEGFLYVVNIQAVGIVDNNFSIVFGYTSLNFDLSENSISLDSDCNIIIKPKK